MQRLGGQESSNQQHARGGYPWPIPGGGQALAAQGKGIHALSAEQRRECAIKGGQASAAAQEAKAAGGHVDEGVLFNARFTKEL